MHEDVARQLIQINQRFYQDFAPAFAATRRRIQPGVRRVLNSLPPHGHWFDLGCGPGALGVEWARSGRSGTYLGLDFSSELLNEARCATAGLDCPGLELRYTQADLGQPGWQAALAGTPWDGALAFAALHHLPGAGRRLNLLRQVRSLLPPGAWFIHSEWQFQHSPKLMARRQPWQAAGLNPADVEPGDTLLDWRQALPGQPQQSALRYVHLFTLQELAELAAASGFEVVETFESDGDGGRLGLYQRWKARGNS